MSKVSTVVIGLKVGLHCEKNNPKVVIPAKDYGMSVEKLDRNWTN